MDPVFFTRTGWPLLSTTMPYGEMIPLFGDYPDGFWDCSVSEMPANYRDTFLLNPPAQPMA